MANPVSQHQDVPAPRQIEAIALEFCDRVAAALQSGELDTIPDDVLRRVLAASVKAYSAKAEAAEGEFPPYEADAVTATETVVTACAIIRAADLNMFDIAMWFQRPMTKL
jgi:hypothetical protein